MRNYFVFKLFEREFYNCLTLVLWVPYFRIFKYDDVPFQGFNISFDTNIALVIEDNGWDFEFKILGFGFKIMRQWSY